MPTGSFDLGLIDQHGRIQLERLIGQTVISLLRRVNVRTVALVSNKQLFDKDSFFIKAFFKVLRWRRMCEFARQRDTRMTYKRELWEFPEGFWGLFI